MGAANSSIVPISNSIGLWIRARVERRLRLSQLAFYGRVPRSETDVYSARVRIN